MAIIGGLNFQTLNTLYREILSFIPSQVRKKCLSTSSLTKLTS